MPREALLPRRRGPLDLQSNAGNSGGLDADAPPPDRATTSAGDVMTKVLVVLTLAMAAMAAVISISNRWTDTPSTRWWRSPW